MKHLFNHLCSFFKHHVCYRMLLSVAAIKHGEGDTPFYANIVKHEQTHHYPKQWQECSDTKLIINACLANLKISEV